MPLRRELSRNDLQANGVSSPPASHELQISTFCRIGRCVEKRVIWWQRSDRKKFVTNTKNSGDPVYLYVDAPAESVLDLLRAYLSKEEMSQISVRQYAHNQAGHISTRGDAEIARTVVEFTLTAIAGGVVYDLTKKAARHLVERFGADRVKEEKLDRLDNQDDQEE